MQTPFEAFKLDVEEIFMEKLAKSPAQTFWRVNSPAHFGGHTGTYTAIQESLVCPGPCLIVMQSTACVQTNPASQVAGRELCVTSLLPTNKAA